MGDAECGGLCGMAIPIESSHYIYYHLPPPTPTNSTGQSWQ